MYRIIIHLANEKTTTNAIIKSCAFTYNFGESSVKNRKRTIIVDNLCFGEM